MDTIITHTWTDYENYFMKSTKLVSLNITYSVVYLYTLYGYHCRGHSSYSHENVLQFHPSQSYNPMHVAVHDDNDEDTIGNNLNISITQVNEHMQLQEVIVIL